MYRKNARLRNLSLLVAVFLVTVVITVMSDSYAWTPAPPQDPVGTSYIDTVCGSSNFYGFTRRIVQCVRDTVLAATDEILAPTLAAFFNVLSACATLAVCFWGFRIATGRSAHAARSGLILALKIAILFLLFGTAAYNFPFFYRAGIDGIGELLGYVTTYMGISTAFSATCAMPPVPEPSLAVWDNVDCALDILIGDFIPNSSISFGVGGFLLALLLTDAVGVFIALLGFLMIIQLLFAILRGLYIFVLAYISFSLMALVAPIFLPMILFQNTRGYFEKWLKLTIGFLLQPIFLFVYLAMLLAAFDTVVYTGKYSLFNTITGGLYPSGCQTQTGTGLGPGGLMACPPIGEWLIDPGAYDPGFTGLGFTAYQDKKYGNVAVNYDVAHVTAGCTSVCPPGGGTQIKPEETGIAGQVGEADTSAAQWNQVTQGLKNNIYEALGIDKYFFQINMPVTNVNWNDLSIMGYAPTTSGYIIDVFLSAIMAVVTSYIFMLLLDLLPFIGSGIMNVFGSLSPGSGASGFGFGGLAPPGASMVDGLRKKVFK